MNLAALVAEHPADRPALHHRGGWLSWGTLRQRAGAGAATLAARGVVADDRVALALPTSPDFVIAYLAVLAVGGVAVPLNPTSPAAELRSELGAVGATTVIAAAPAAERLAPIAADDGFGLVTVGAVDAAADGGWEAMTGADAAFAPLSRRTSDLAALLFTSGTAGPPRAAMLTHGNLVANLHQMLAVPGEMVRADDVVTGAVPLFHVFGLNVVLGLTLATGAALVLDERFDAAGSLREIEDLGVTLVFGVPAMFSAWADAGAHRAGSPESPLRRVRRAVSGAAPLAPAVSSLFEERFGVPVWQGYGLTEAGPAVSTSLGTAGATPGSVGRPLPGVALRLVDEDDSDVLVGDPGEIWVRGPNVFVGYWGDEEASVRVLTPDGWLRTGDVGVLDPAGELSVVDRAKDLIIVSGFNVFPGEVEQCIAALAGVAEAVVVGGPDAGTGEAVQAVVVRRPAATVTADDVVAQCRAGLAGYKCPTAVRFVDELPHGLAGKALRRAVRDGA